MKVPIKFRGYYTCDGVRKKKTIDFEKFLACTMIEPDTIEQLVGYDANGAEVYEGDVLTLEDGKQVSPEWEIVFRDNKGESYYAREEILKW